MANISQKRDDGCLIRSFYTRQKKNDAIVKSKGGCAVNDRPAYMCLPIQKAELRQGLSAIQVLAIGYRLKYSRLKVSTIK